MCVGSPKQVILIKNTSARDLNQHEIHCKLYTLSLKKIKSQNTFISSKYKLEDGPSTMERNNYIKKRYESIIL